MRLPDPIAESPARPLRCAIPAILAACCALAGPVLAEPADEAADKMAMECLRLSRNQPQEAIGIADSALGQEGVPIQAQIKLQVCAGRAAAIVGDLVRTQAAIERIDAALAEHPVPPEFALRALSNVGAMLHSIGRIAPALDYYQRALEAARAQDAITAEISLTINVALIHSEVMGAYAEAEALFARAQEHVRDLRDQGSVSLANLHYNRGQNLLRLERDDDALRQLDDAIAAHAADPSAQDGLVGMRARAERAVLLARRSPSPEAWAEVEALVRRQRESEPVGAAITLTRWSQALLAQGDAAAALVRVQDAKTLLAAGFAPFEWHEALQAEVAAQRALGQWREAADGMQMLRELETAQLRTFGLENLARLQAGLQDARRLAELEHLRAEREKEALALEHSRRLRNWALLALGVLAALGVAFVLHERKVKRSLRHLGTTDALTGLLNRGAAVESLKRIASGSDAARLVVFLIDIDHFKRHNDRYGHHTGDAILIEVAARLHGRCGPDDIVARWGGEEFLVICPDFDLERAAQRAEALRRTAVEASVAAVAQGYSPLTLSLGFACVPFFPGGAEPGN